MDKKEKIKYALEQLMVQGNSNAVDTIFTANYIAHAANKEHKGLKFLKQFTELLHASIPDIKVLNVEIFIEENNTISWQRTLQGTHKKNMMGIPASNKTIKWNELVVSRFDGDKIAEEWIVSELMGQLLLQRPKTK